MINLFKNKSVIFFLNGQNAFRFFLILGLVSLTINALSGIMYFLGMTEMFYSFLKSNIIIESIGSWVWIFSALIFVMYHKYSWRNELLLFAILILLEVLSRISFWLFFGGSYEYWEMQNVFQKVITSVSDITIALIIYFLLKDAFSKNILELKVVSVLWSASFFLSIAYQYVMKSAINPLNIQSYSSFYTMLYFSELALVGGLIYLIAEVFYNHKKGEDEEIGDLDF